MLSSPILALLLRANVLRVAGADKTCQPAKAVLAVTMRADVRPPRRHNLPPVALLGEHNSPVRFVTSQV